RRVLVARALRPDAHHLDRGDRAAPFARALALAAAEPRRTLTAERGQGLGVAARRGLEGADRAHGEARRLGERDLAPPRRGPPRRVLELEPEQDARAARPVDLAPHERVPDRAAVAAPGVHRDESPWIHEARHALALDEAAEAALRLGRRGLGAPG